MNKDCRIVPVTIIKTCSKTFQLAIPEDKFSIESDEDGSFQEFGEFTQQDLLDMIVEQHGSEFDYVMNDWLEEDFQIIYGEE